MFRELSRFHCPEKCGITLEVCVHIRIVVSSRMLLYSAEVVHRCIPVYSKPFVAFWVLTHKVSFNQLTVKTLKYTLAKRTSSVHIIW